jgi:cytochrome c-type biogenesis protein CcmH
MFWIAVAVLAAAVTFVVTRPLMQAPVAAVDETQADLAVYKDQLAEIETDAARGVISGVEAEAARAEVARRLLRRPDDLTVVSSTTISNVPVVSRLLKPVLMATTLALPLASLALYMTYGAPGLPGVPLQERIAAPVDGMRPDDLIAKVEARLKDQPDDGTGWDVIAPVYLSAGRYGDAAAAYAKAMKLLGENPGRLQGFANARIRAENGLVPDDARRALQALIDKDPKLKEPRVWLALAKEQDGKLAEAAGDYRALIADAPDGAPWRAALQERLTKIEGGSKPEASAAPSAATVPKGGPDAASVAAVEAMPPADQQAFIARMVDGLAERMKTNAKDKDGWLKLIRAYQVLGRKDDAVKALASAKAGLEGDTAAWRDVEALAKELGVGG